MSSRLLVMFLAFAILAPGVASADDILNVENWPGDIPCNVLKRHPDATYEITVPWRRFFTTHLAGVTYRHTRETQFWDAACKGKTL
jgi:hypothetical protein